MLDPRLMGFLAADDPGHQYGIPWSSGTDGDGINVERVQAVLGKDAKLDILDLLFDPKNAAKESANLTNDTSYPSAVSSASKLLHPDVLSDPAVFPPPEEFNKLYAVKPLPTDINRLINRLWQQFKIA